MRGDMADEARDSISSEEVTEAPLNVSFAKPLASGSLQTQVGWLKLALANWLLGPKMGFIFPSPAQVQVGHWGNVMPPVLVNNLVPSHTVPAIQVLPTF